MTKKKRQVTGLKEVTKKITDLGFLTEMTNTEEYEQELSLFVNECKMHEDDLEDTEAILDHSVDIKTGKMVFSVATKKFALLLLESMIHPSGQYEGKPQYFRVGQLLGIDARILFNWNTRDKNIIMNQVSSFDSNIKEYVKLKLNIQMLKVLNEMGTRNLSEITDRNLISMLDSLYHKWRLEHGESTDNKAVVHKIALPPPIEY